MPFSGELERCGWPCNEMGRDVKEVFWSVLLWSGVAASRDLAYSAMYYNVQ